MAIYQVQVIGRSQGRSAVAAAAYRSASEIHDQRQGQSFDYSDKPNVVHSEIFSPTNAPAWVHDRESLWNSVESGERRKDSQVAREVEFAIPQELSQAEGIALVREFAQREFVAHGMVADLNVHWEED